MRKLATALAVASLFAASVAVDAVAQTQSGQPQPAPRDRAQGERRDADRDKGNLSKGLKPGTVKASDLIGKNAENQNKENVGEIKDLLIDRNGNRVAYVIFDPADALFQDDAARRTGAAPGAPAPGAPAPGGTPPARTDAARAADDYRDKYMALPLNQFKVADGKLIAAFERDKIRKAPSFPKDRWPEDFADVDKHFGVSGAQAGQADKKEKYVRASEFLKMNVRNPQNEKLGDIQDLVVDMNSGRVLYAVMGAGGFLGLGEKLFAIPVNAFSFATDDKELVLQADKDRLKNAEGFDKNSWPATASSGWQGQGGQQPRQPQRQPAGKSS